MKSGKSPSNKLSTAKGITQQKVVKPDFWVVLTNDQKREIAIARKQVENGEVEEWEAVYQRLLSR